MDSSFDEDAIIADMVPSETGIPVLKLLDLVKNDGTMFMKNLLRNSNHGAFDPSVLLFHWAAVYIVIA